MAVGAGNSRLRQALASEGERGRERTLADRAYTLVHDAIIRGDIAPGDRLPIDELAASLGMSPMPVREALRRLDAVGLVEHVPHRGATVTELSVSDLVNLYEARLALEPLAVRHAAERLTSEGEAEARTAFVALTAEAPGSPELWQAHTRFHFALYRLAASRWLLRLITPLWESSERYRTATNARDVDIRQAEHEAILQAVTERRPERAQALMYNHLAKTANDQANLLANRDVFAPVKVPNG